MKKMTSVNTFLVEIIIVTLFFSLCVAITLQLFVAAHTKSSLSSDTSIAIIKVQTQAEIFKSLNQMDQTQTAYNYAQMEIVGDTVQYKILYDKDWNQTKTKPRFIINIKIEEELKKHSKMLTAKIEAIKIKDEKEDTLCCVEAKKYIE